jgi:hypothetical protein
VAVSSLDDAPLEFPSANKKAGPWPGTTEVSDAPIHPYHASAANISRIQTNTLDCSSRWNKLGDYVELIESRDYISGRVSLPRYHHIEHQLHHQPRHPEWRLKCK